MLGIHNKAAAIMLLLSAMTNSPGMMVQFQQMKSGLGIKVEDL